MSYTGKKSVESVILVPLLLMLPLSELVVALLELTEALSIEDDSIDQHCCYDVGIDVGSRTSVLKIALLVMDSLSWNSNALTAMSCSESKFL